MKQIIKKELIQIGFVIIAVALAIASKVMLPSGDKEVVFDSILVKKIGFPVVAILYFVIVYSYNIIMVRYFGTKSSIDRIKTGLRFGLCFALIYLGGMQEVIVEASPYTVYGIAFIVYQFFMGIGEAVSVLLLCLAVGTWILPENKSTNHVNVLTYKEKARILLMTTLGFTIERAINYQTGLTSSDVNSYPVQTYLWTVIFGLCLGGCILLIIPVIKKDIRSHFLIEKMTVFVIGVTWIIFNCFIGFVFKGAIKDCIYRSGCDTLAIFISVSLWHLIENRSPTSK